jgi:hypothetical protein
VVLPIMCYVKQVDEQKEDFAMQQRYVDLLIDALLDEGFTVDEARRLILLQEEYEERRATEETNYHRFVRWLVEHGRLSEW